jgi:hypothetical protein
MNVQVKVEGGEAWKLSRHEPCWVTGRRICDTCEEGTFAVITIKTCDAKYIEKEKNKRC